MTSRTRRAAAAAITLAAATAGFVPTASAAEYYIQFGAGPDASSVSAGHTGHYSAVQLDLSRAGQVIASDTRIAGGTRVSLATLEAGDVARLYVQDELRATATYDGLPTLSDDVCIGSSTVTGTRAPEARISIVDSWTPTGKFTALFNRSTIDDSANFTVSFERPLARGSSVTVTTSQDFGTYAVTSVYSRRAYRDCPPPPPAPPEPVTPAPPQPPVPTDAQVRAAVRAAVAQAGAKLRAHSLRTLATRRTIALPFAASEAGTIQLTLTGPGGRRVGGGNGSIGAAGTATVALKLSPAGRKLARRAKSAKLRLAATFAPARAGAPPQTGHSALTLTRRK